MGVVLSSPVIQSTQPIEAETVQTTESTAGAVESPLDACPEEMPSEHNHATEMTQSTAVNNGATAEGGATNGPLLAVASAPMARSSRYILISDISRSQLICNLVIEKNWMKLLNMVIR